MTSRLIAAVALIVLAASHAQAQVQTTDSSQSDIVVTGVRREQIQSFVEQVSAVPPNVNQLSRWDDDICLSVAGLSEEQGQIVVDRVSSRAQAVGLSAGRTGCQPNAYVFFAADATDFTRRLVDEHTSLFAYYREEHIATLGREAFTAFVETARPIRWWHVIQTRGADGDRLGSDQAGNRAPPPPSEIRVGEPPEADALTGLQSVRSNGSRLRAAERQDFNRVVVVVDGGRVSGYPLEAIADYIALVTLAQIDAQAQTSDYPTILNLFDDDPDMVSFEMTNWDRAYLDGLYRTARNAASVSQQVRDISRHMVGDGGG